MQAGTHRVAHAVKTMTAIVDPVRRVNEPIGEIDVATGEQTQGIGLDSSAVSPLDAAMQQSAALVEQSSTAASSLKQQADERVPTVRHFSVQSA